MSVYCENCSYKNNSGERFCFKCGKDLIVTAKNGDLVTGVLLDKRYEIKNIIKKGGMGTIYLAIDRRFQDSPCVVKEMLSKDNVTEENKRQYMIEQFKKEAKILHDLRHSNLPVVKDYFIQSGRYYLVMDYIEGEDLKTILLAYGDKGIKEEFVIDWTRQILEVFNYLHNQRPSIIYRDLKPENLMLRKSDQRIILIDFGIARTLNPDIDTTVTVIGTPPYSPPEVFRGKTEVRSDIYSLGATMHALLTGKIPDGPFSFDPLDNIKPDISKELTHIVEKALSMHIDNRYSTAQEMLDAIDRLSLKKASRSFLETIKEIYIKKSTGKKRSGSVSDIFTDGEKVSDRTIRKSKPVKGEKKPVKKIGKYFDIIRPLIIIIILSISAYLLVFQDSKTDKLYKKAVKLSGEGKYEEAISFYDKALEIEPGWKNALNGKRDAMNAIGDLLTVQKKYEDAISFYDKTLEIEPGYEKALNGKKEIMKARGDLFMSQKKYTEAIYFYNKALKLDGNDINLWNLKGDILFKEKKYEEAIKCYDKIIGFIPDSSKAWYSKGKVLGTAGKIEEAIKCFNKSLELDIDNKEAWNGLGTVLFTQKKYRESIDCYNRALNIDPSFVKALDNKGLSLYNQGKYSESIENFDKALGIDPLFVKSWINKGNIFYNQKNYVEAIKCYDKVIEIEPGNKIALINRENARKILLLQ